MNNLAGIFEIALRILFNEPQFHTWERYRLSFGRLAIIATEYPTNDAATLRAVHTPRVYSGDPLGVCRSIWIGRLSAGVKPGDFPGTVKDTKAKWCFGVGVVRPWVHARHVAVSINGKRFEAETGHVDIHPPVLVTEPGPITVSVRNDTPYLSPRNTADPPLSGALLVHVEYHPSGDFAPTTGVGVFPLSLVEIEPKALRDVQIPQAEPFPFAYGARSITAIDWYTWPAGASRAARLHGRPEWYDSES